MRSGSGVYQTDFSLNRKQRSLLFYDDLRPVPEALAIYFERSASAKVEELLILESFECTDGAFNENIIFR